MQSIAGIQYQIALALLAPEHLMDFARRPPFATPALRRLAAKVRIRGDARLEAQYPETWLARVVVERSGKRQSVVVSIPRGDARNPMEWKDVLAKAADYHAVLTAIRTAGLQDPIPHEILDALP